MAAGRGQVTTRAALIGSEEEYKHTRRRKKDKDGTGP